jgi:hypothetical protein
MNKWHDVKVDGKVKRLGVTAIRVKYIYYEKQVPSWCRNHTAFKFSEPFVAYMKATRDVGIIHLTDEGLQWSDLKGFYQHITHWMYINEPYDESEEKLGPLKFDYDGSIIDDEDNDNNNERNNDMSNSEFVKEKSVKVFNPKAFEFGAPYLILSKENPTREFVGLFLKCNGAEDEISFLFADKSSISSGVLTINVEYIDDWFIKKIDVCTTPEENEMIRMWEEEV